MVLVVLTPVKVFAAVTVALATTEPEGSVTVPSIAPVPPVCAFECREKIGLDSERIIVAQANQYQLFMKINIFHGVSSGLPPPLNAGPLRAKGRFPANTAGPEPDL